MSRQSEQPIERSPTDPYTIRPYEPQDRASYLDLYESVLADPQTSADRIDAWFRWKYEDNPYADHVPMIVATTDDGSVVGAKPCFAMELRAGEETAIGYQPADVAVHPDHRRRGLYSRTTERLKEHYRGRDPSLFFNFPNEVTLSGSLKHGWKVVEEVSTWYRPQSPAAILGEVDHPVADAAVRASGPLVRGALRIHEAFAQGASNPIASGLSPAQATHRSSRVRVTRHTQLPTETLAALYRRAVPRQLHAHRTESFYAWRFANPTWTYRTYVAHVGGSPVSAIVTGRRTTDGSTTVHLADVVPLLPTDGRRIGLQALLARIVADHRDADVLAVSGDAIDGSLLSRFGFLSDTAFPLSRFSSPTTQVAYPLAEGPPWTVAGLTITNPANWLVTYCEQDTS